jgi:hypothetical protein
VERFHVRRDIYAEARDDLRGGDMILYCNFEELTAISAAAERILQQSDAGGIEPVMAPPELVADIEALTGRDIGDMSITTLGQQRSVHRAMEHLLSEARRTMDHFVLQLHAADEQAVASYFEYAHILTVLERVRLIGEQMRAVIELVTGQAPTPDDLYEFTFPD